MKDKEKTKIKNELKDFVSHALVNHYKNTHDREQANVQKIFEDLNRLYDYLGIELKWHKPKEGRYTLVKKNEKRK